MPTYFARLTLTQPKTLTYFKFEPHPNEVNTFPIYVSQVSGIFLQRFIRRLYDFFGRNNSLFGEVSPNIYKNSFVNSPLIFSFPKSI